MKKRIISVLLLLSLALGMVATMSACSSGSAGHYDKMTKYAMDSAKRKLGR